MKTLVVIRHAKSSWEHGFLADDLRPLNNRGRADAPKVGRYLADQGLEFDAVLSSPAVRAKTTAALVCQEVGFPLDHIVLVDDFYNFGDDGSEILYHVMQQDRAKDTIAVFGHNETFHYLASRLSKGKVAEFPTCACLVVSWQIEDWAKLRVDEARVVLSVVPRDL